MAPGTMVKSGTPYEVGSYCAWRIAFYNTSRTWLVFGSKEDAKKAAKKIEAHILKQGGYVSNLSIKEVTKYLGK